jgi:hypothetical protein
MIVYRHPCPHDDIAERQTLLDQADIPNGYDAILVPTNQRTGWTATDVSDGHWGPIPSCHQSIMVQRTAIMYATLPIDILRRIPAITNTD